MNKNASFQFNSQSKVPEIGAILDVPPTQDTQDASGNEGLAWDFSSLKIYI